MEGVNEETCVELEVEKGLSDVVDGKAGETRKYTYHLGKLFKTVQRLFKLSRATKPHRFAQTIQENSKGLILSDRTSSGN